MCKLTFKNVKLFNIIQNDTFIRTPEASEISELEYLYDLADSLYFATMNNKVCNKKFIKLATQLDSIPLVGEYFRKLLYQDGF